MLLTKITQLCENANNLSFLQVVQNKLVTNDNYIGLQVLSGDLELLDKIPLFEDVLIYSSYVSNRKEELVLYCAENDRMIYVDVNTGSHSIINLEGELAQVVFPDLYHWVEDSLIIYAYSGEFYKLLMFEQAIVKLDEEEVTENYPFFYDFCMEAQGRGRREVFSNDYQFVVVDETRCTVSLHDYLNKRVYTVPLIGPVPHQVAFEQGLFALVCEDRVTLCSEGGVTAVVELEKKDYFLWARFLRRPEARCIALLSGSKSDALQRSIAVYRVT